MRSVLAEWTNSKSGQEEDMTAQRKSILRRLLSTESEWNPKVMFGRAVVRVLPDNALHRFKKTYYACLIKHTPEDWMERDASIAKRFISPGDTVVDVGASLGYFARFFSRCVGQSGKVYAFEPIPQTFEFLTNNIRKLGLRNVEPFDFALSDGDRTETMVIPTYRWGAECWYDAQIKTEKGNPAWRQIEVRSRALDKFFAERGRAPQVTFIKCDANYHELAVLQGALQTIRASHPAMLIEINPDPDDSTTTAFATFDLLHTEGYQPYWFNGEVLLRRKPGERSQNYFFLTSAHVNALATNEPTRAEA
jgi:FkbM family methyltransferase